jgi:hypothetical protein
MRRKKRFLIAAFCTFSMMINGVAVVAQSRDKKQEPKSGAQQAPEAPSNNLFFFPPEPTLHIAYAAPQADFIYNEFGLDGGVVKDAPYSAEAVTETIQTLGDGNRIVRNSSSKIYRDSAGRRRREQAMKAIGLGAVSGETPIIITIHDPVASVHYNLNSSTKTAHKVMTRQALDLGQGPKAPADEVWKAKMKDQPKLKAANGAEAGGAVSSVVSETNQSRGPGDLAELLEVVAAARSQASDGVGAGATPRAIIGAIGPGVQRSVGNGVFPWSGEGEVKMESLGRQTIEGVEADGQRVTVTIPAGKIGNERPIVTVSDRWFSPELRTIVFSKNIDPRMGETTYRLTNIDRSEPDPSLFQVPDDYTVEEGGFGRRLLPAEPPRVEIQRRAKRPSEN